MLTGVGGFVLGLIFLALGLFLYMRKKVSGRDTGWGVPGVRGVSCAWGGGVRFCPTGAAPAPTLTLSLCFRALRSPGCRKRPSAPTLLHPPCVGWCPAAPRGSVSVWSVSPIAPGRALGTHGPIPVVTLSSLPTGLLNELLPLRICSAAVRPLPPSVTSASRCPGPEPHVPTLIPGVTPSHPSSASLSLLCSPGVPRALRRWPSAAPALPNKVSWYPPALVIWGQWGRGGSLPSLWPWVHDRALSPQWGPDVLGGLGLPTVGGHCEGGPTPRPVEGAGGRACIQPPPGMDQGWG